MQVNNTRYHTKKQGRWMSPILTDALYNVVFIVIMNEVWIYFERFVFVFSLLFWGNKLLSCYLWTTIFPQNRSPRLLDPLLNSTLLAFFSSSRRHASRYQGMTLVFHWWEITSADRKSLIALLWFVGLMDFVLYSFSGRR